MQDLPTSIVRPITRTTITLEDDSDNEEFIPDSQLLCFAEILYRCRLCLSHSSCAGKSSVFKKMENFITHLRSQHPKILSDSVSLQNSHLKNTNHRVPSGNTQTSTATSVVQTNTLPLQTEPVGNHDPEQLEPDKSITKKPMLQTLLSQNFKQHIQQNLGTQQSEELLSDINRNVVISDVTVNPSSPGDKGSPSSLRKSRRKNSHPQPSHLPLVDHYSPSNSKIRRLSTEETNDIHLSTQSDPENSPVHQLVIKTELTDNDADMVTDNQMAADIADGTGHHDQNVQQSLVHHKPEKYRHVAHSIAEKNLTELQKNETGEAEAVSDCNASPKLYATLRNILNTASHTALQPTPLKVLQELYDCSLNETSHVSEYTKVSKLSEVLKDFVFVDKSGVVCREDLLSRLFDKIVEDTNSSCISTGSNHWGSACNRAVRDVFPESTTTRKGKFKKTFYFGIALLDPANECEDVQVVREKMLHPKTFETSKASEGDSDPGKWLHEMHMLQMQLPEIIQWTGNLENYLARDELLQQLSLSNKNSAILDWGASCNKTMRQLFPGVDIRRKGKLKATYFYGLCLKSQMRGNMPQEMEPRWLQGTASTPRFTKHPGYMIKTPPPVVNVRHLTQQEDLDPISKLKPTTNQPIKEEHDDAMDLSIDSKTNY